MRNMIRNAAFLGSLMLSTMAFAQDKSAATEPTYTLSAEQMTQELGLSPDQSEKMKSIEESINQQFLKLEELEPAKRDVKQAELMKKRSMAVASVLTPDQEKKLETVVAEYLKARKAEKVKPAAK